MKAVGIVRKVDRLGRIVLPKELRDKFDIDAEANDPVEIFVDGDYIMLKKYNPSCIFCGSVNEIQTVHGKLVCEKCIKELKTIK